MTTQPPSWTAARDAAADLESESAERWPLKPTYADYAYGVKIGFQRGADFGRTFELERAKALVEAIRGVLGHHALFIHTTGAALPKHIKKCEEALKAYGGQRE